MGSNSEASQGRASVGRPFSTSSFALELDGVFTGFVPSVAGGQITGVVVEETVSSGNFVKKHIAGVKYDDVTITADLSLDPVIYGWIEDSWKRSFSRKDGTIHILDPNFKILSQIDFYNALIRSVTLPMLDAASKDAARMTIKFSPEYTRFKKGSGAKLKIPAKHPQKAWLPSNFRLAIDGLECKRVSKVDALTVKQPVARDPVGEARDALIEPGKVDFPNLVVSVPEVDAQTWLEWHEDFVIKGNNGDDQERKGTLTYLSADLKTTLAEVGFSNLGIFRITRDKVEAASDKVSTFTVELYVEHMTFTLGKAN